jgi:hypothetical protein
MVYRKQRAQEAEKKERQAEQALLPQWQQQQLRDEERGQLEAGNRYEGAENTRRESLEALVPDCNKVGTFERFGDADVAFICDFCDGHIVWAGVAGMPAARTQPTSAVDARYPNWAASAPSPTPGEAPRSVVFAPLAVANHLPPQGPQAWEARLWCPFCDEYTYHGQFDDEQTRYAQPDEGFETLADFQAHLEFWHTAMPVPSLRNAGGKSCGVM